MGTTVFLVHYHEIGLKGCNRNVFERRLLDNLKASLHCFAGTRVQRISGHLLVTPGPGATEEALRSMYACIGQTPGVARTSWCSRVGLVPEEYCAAAYAALAESGDFESFKVHARRSNTTLEKTSVELNCEIGSYLCERFPGKRVQMHHPDKTVTVYVIQGSAYVYVDSELGVGGLPVGSANKVISLLSSGIDSPVASWRIARRGAVVIGLHFSGRPQTADTSEWLVQDIIERLSATAGIGRLYVVPFGDIQRRIASTVPADLLVLMYRRMMFAFACRLAQIEHAKALVTGESLGQVASQTLENIAVVDEMATIPVLRPLIGNDKREIMADAQRLGTFEISTEQADDCCTLFMPRTPETHCSLRKAHAAWESFDHEGMLDEMMGLLEYRSFNCPAYVPPRRLSQLHDSLEAAQFETAGSESGGSETTR